MSPRVHRSCHLLHIHCTPGEDPPLCLLPSVCSPLLADFHPSSLSGPGSGGWGSVGIPCSPLQGALPGFQETLDKELRISIRKIISDSVFFMERCSAAPPPPVPA